MHMYTMLFWLYICCFSLWAYHSCILILLASYTCLFIECKGKQWLYRSVLFFQKYFSPEDLGEIMKGLKCAIHQGNVSITSARLHICMQNRFSYSIFINLSACIVYLAICPQCCQQTRWHWPSLHYGQRLVFVCVSGNGMVAVQCVVSSFQ